MAIVNDPASILGRVTHGMGTAKEGRLVREAFYQLYAWAVTHGLVDHVEGSDDIALVINRMVENVINPSNIERVRV